MKSDSILNKLEEVESNLRDEIKASVQTKFLDVSTNIKDLIEIATEVWRLEARVNKLQKGIGEDTYKVFTNSFEKIKRLISKNDLEIKDYTGEKYSTSITAIDIVSVDRDPSVREDTIKETLEPAIYLRGQIVKKSKVILLAKDK